MTMRIAFFSKHLPSDEPNGVSVQVDRLASALVKNGHALTCFSFSPPPPDAPYETVRLPWKRSSRLARKFEPALAFRKIDGRPFDIRHYHGDDWLCAGGSRRVRTFYGSALFEALHARSAGRFLYQALFYKLEWLSCLRRGATAGISAATGRALPLVRRVIPCGVPLDRFSPEPARKTACPSILFIGDFSSRKRGDLLLKAFREQVLPAHPECQLTVVGPEPAEGRGLRWLGRAEENALIGEYRRAWICCLPSSYEGFGVPAVEAMACGTAVVAAENAGVAEVVDHGRNGLLCMPETLGKTLLSVIENRDQREKLTAGGLEKARRYDITEIARQYEQLYRAAAAAGRRR